MGVCLELCFTSCDWESVTTIIADSVKSVLYAFAYKNVTTFLIYDRFIALTRGTEM